MASALAVYSGLSKLTPTLGGEIVDLGRPDLLHQPDQVGRVGHVAVMQQERHIAGMRILVEVIDAGGVERGRPPLDAMDLIAETEQIFGKIGAVLAGDAGDQRHALRILSRHRSLQEPAGQIRATIKAQSSELTSRVRRKPRAAQAIASARRRV
jgi:hypothetical protein